MSIVTLLQSPTKRATWWSKGVLEQQALTAAEALKIGKLDWIVEKRPIYREHEGQFKEIQTHRVIVRTDTNVELGVVGRNYQEVNNEPMFNFLDKIVGVQAASYYAVGQTGKGERVWVLMKLPEGVEITPGDFITPYLFIGNSHDGTLRLTVNWCGVRELTQTTLMLNFGNTGQARRKHTLNITKRPEHMQEQLGILNTLRAFFQEQAKKMSGKFLTPEQWTEYKNRTMEWDKTPEGGRAEGIKDTLDTLWGQKGNQNLWEAFNVFSEFVDFHRSTRTGEEGTEAKRQESSLFGSGNALRQRAWDTALIYI